MSGLREAVARLWKYSKSAFWACVALFLAGGGVLLMTIAFEKCGDWREEARSRSRHEAILRSIGTETKSFQSETYRGTTELRTRYDEFTMSYRLLFRAAPGNVIESSSGAVIVLAFLDDQGMLLQNVTLSSFTRGMNERGVVESLQSLGQETFDASKYLRIASVSVSHTLSIVPESAPGPSRAEFEDDVAAYTERAKAIRIGMTYAQMVSAAGAPRVEAKTTPDEWLAGYGFKKYNYGKRWVLFRDELVAKVR